MGKKEAREYIQLKVSQPLINLKSWNFYDWFIFWILIPLFIVGIFYFPPSFKENYLILNTSTRQVTAILLHEFTHSTYSHLLGNIGFYYLWMGILFAFERSKKVFHYAALFILSSVIIVGSIVTVIFWEIIGKVGTSQGFSGIVAAFSAYALIAFLRWGFCDIIRSFPDWYRLNLIQKISFIVFEILLAIAFIVVIQEGLNLGQFISGNGFVSNGIVHFTGFLLGLIIPLFLYWKFVQKEILFNSMIIFSVFYVIFRYYHYLLNVINAVRGSG
jgi:hypothetical protein